MVIPENSDAALLPDTPFAADDLMKVGTLLWPPPIPPTVAKGSAGPWPLTISP